MEGLKDNKCSLKMKKHSFKYFIKFGVISYEKDLEEQRVKKRDRIRWELSESLDARRRLEMQRVEMRTIKRIRSISLKDRESLNKKDLGISVIKCVQIREALKQNKGLAKIQMSFSPCYVESLDLKKVKILIEGLKSLKALQIVHFDLFGGSLQPIESIVKRLCALKALVIGIPHEIWLDDRSLQKLGKSVRRLPNLQSIDATIPSETMTSQGVFQLGQELKQIRSLQNVSFAFLWKLMEDAQNVGESLKEMEKLQSIKICFSREQLCAFWQKCRRCQRFSPIFEGLASASLQNISLESLQLQRTDDQELKIFCQSLAKLNSLQGLDLLLSMSPGITHEGIEALSEALKKLSCLKTLSLGFSEIFLKDQGVFILSQSLKELSCLRRIKLRFWDYEEISPEALQALCQSLKGLIQISILGYFQISDSGLQVLGESLKELSFLEILDLEIECCEITNNGLKTFAEALSQIKSLQKVNFSLRDFFEVNSERRIQKLFRYFEEICSVKKINLSFSNCFPLKETNTECFL